MLFFNYIIGGNNHLFYTDRCIVAGQTTHTTDNTKKPPRCKAWEQFSDPKGALFMNLRDSLHQNANVIKHKANMRPTRLTLQQSKRKEVVHLFQFEFCCFDSEAWDTAAVIAILRQYRLFFNFSHTSNTPRKCPRHSISLKKFFSRHFKLLMYLFYHRFFKKSYLYQG